MNVPAGSLTILPRLLESAIESLCDYTGFSREALQLGRLRTALEAERTQQGEAVLLARLGRRDPLVLDSLIRSILVGETYFFRHPEQFTFLFERVLAPAVQDGRRALRGWSAGCSSGEETYSLASTLLSSMRALPDAQVEVLGSDLDVDALERARTASFGSWSVRENCPELHPTLSRSADGRYRVLPAVRAVTRFVRHNLLDAPEFGPFDVILCRNVLCYLRPEATDQVLERLASALAPRGVLVCSAVDVERAPRGLVRLGPPELQIFQRPLHQVTPAPARPAAALPATPPSSRSTTSQPMSPMISHSAAPASAPASAPSFAPQSAASSEGPLSEACCIAEHVHALRWIEEDDAHSARGVLESLIVRAPRYVPALLELALLDLREGQDAHAIQRMASVLTALEGLEEDAVVPGPEPLTVAFFRASARSYLEARRRP